MYIISVSMSDVIAVNLIELIINATFNLSWIKNKNSDFGFVILIKGM